MRLAPIFLLKKLMLSTRERVQIFTKTERIDRAILSILDTDREMFYGSRPDRRSRRVSRAEKTARRAYRSVRLGNWGKIWILLYIAHVIGVDLSFG